MSEIYVSGVKEIHAAFDKIIRQTRAVNRAIVAEAAAVVEAEAKRNFSGSHKRGAPHVGGRKPNTVTGTLRRSIGHEAIVNDGIGGAATVLGPRTIYGRRVELGFVGTDSLGRHYDQPPFPYFTPAVRATRTKVSQIARRRWTASTRP